jgi:hypothetical protein
MKKKRRSEALLLEIGWDLPLEDDLRAELQAPASNTIRHEITGEGIATVEVEFVAAELGDTKGRNGCIVDILNGNAEPLVVEEVEGLGLKLDGETFCNFRVLEHSHIDRADGLAPFSVSAEGRKGRSEELLCRDVVDDEMGLAQGDGVSVVHTGQSAIRCCRTRAHADRGERSTEIAGERAASIDGSKGKVRGVTETLSRCLLHGPGLAAVVAICSVDLPSTHQMTQEAWLVLFEGYVVNPERGKDVGKIIVADGTLCPAQIKWILRE